MYQRDYVLRMIEMLGDFLRAIMGWIKKGELQKASQTLENAYYEVLRQDASFFHNIPGNELTKKLIQEHNYTNGHLEILAELFYAEAELRYAKGNREGCIEFYNKSLLLFEFVEKETKTYNPEKKTKIESIQGRLKELTIA
jgi:hypothetical protein